MPAGFRLDDREDIGCPTALILGVALRHMTGPRGPRRPDIGVQGDGFLIQTDHRFGGAVRPFVHGQDIFHARDVGGIQLSDAPHFFPATA